ncbi:MAG TPA: hypothetical protein VGN82_08965 [Bosea sp. (in: a-proteobacteria)]|jgi:hypothetical protein|uniref:hypothetical protein n=1 Tax=Bosea sp. (in: a-proteobacteria) TaxID=1871050 RepID=UPI002E0E89C4|nr:hypothetical protein [Bosea sp. (in: a-proteobacteria)]
MRCPIIVGDGRGAALAAACAGILLALAEPAFAHVKWFAPYIVNAPPQTLWQVLADRWFWTGTVLVTVFFLLTRAIEGSRYGEVLHRGLDGLTAPLWHRLDDYVRVTVGAFFVAIFSVGGVYLTPDLKTPAEWVSWLQLAIAACIFFRATMPLAGAGIVLLWLLALRDYDLFHLFDYLALGLGVAGYLILEPSRNEEWRSHRFEVLRWGLAIALMWSSLEKFAFPSWFDPIVDEKPFLTFGMPRDAFIPMAGVAEFTMGFGLIWTPLIRRLSAVALLVIFTAAVWPFGRIDLIGHGLIMAILVAVACDRCRKTRFLPDLKAHLPAIPLGIACALVLFAGAYWGLHTTIYGQDGAAEARAGDRSTHSYSQEHPHGPGAPASSGAAQRR